MRTADVAAPEAEVEHDLRSRLARARLLHLLDAVDSIPTRSQTAEILDAIGDLPWSSFASLRHLLALRLRMRVERLDDEWAASRGLVR
jgi:hypothetical protein